MLFVLIDLANAGDVSVIPTPVPVVADSKQFLSYLEGMIIIPNFSTVKLIGDLGANSVFKVPTSELKSYGINIGTIIQSVDIEKGVKNPDFIVKDYVYGIVPTDQGDNAYEKLRVILSYDEDKISLIKKISSFSEYATGFGYIGTKRKLIEIKFNLIPTTPVKKVNFKYSGWDLNKKEVTMKSINIFNNVFYIYNDSGPEGPFSTGIKTPTSFHKLFTTTFSLRNEDSFLLVADWEKQKVVLLNVKGIEGCMDLYFFYKDSVEVAPLPCNRN